MRSGRASRARGGTGPRRCRPCEASCASCPRSRVRSTLGLAAASCRAYHSNHRHVSVSRHRNVGDRCHRYIGVSALPRLVTRLYSTAVLIWHERCYGVSAVRRIASPGYQGDPRPMLTVGDKLPAFDLQAVVSLEKGKEFQRDHERELPGQVAGPVLLADGLHLHLPDRDRRVRQAQRATSRTATRRCSARARTPTSSTSRGARATTT